MPFSGAIYVFRAKSARSDQVDPLVRHRLKAARSAERKSKTAQLRLSAAHLRFDQYERLRGLSAKGEELPPLVPHSICRRGSPMALGDLTNN